MHVAVAQAGPVQIELIKEHTDGPSVLSDRADWYGMKTTWLHQLSTLARNYEAKRDYYQGLGYALACEFRAGTQRIAYFDTVADFGFFIEVIEETPSFLFNLGAIARACAEWDDSDPIRILTRDGYRTTTS